MLYEVITSATDGLCLRLPILTATATLTELGIFSAMWNEHCSYKSSKVHLRTLPTKAEWVIQGPGENAGVIVTGPGPGMFCAGACRGQHRGPETGRGNAADRARLRRDLRRDSYNFV